MKRETAEQLARRFERNARQCASHAKAGGAGDITGPEWDRSSKVWALAGELVREALDSEADGE